MSVTIADIVSDTSLHNVKLISGQKLSDRQISQITSDLDETGTGLLYIISQPFIDVERLADARPDAAGFVVKSGYPASEQGLPLISCDEPEELYTHWEKECRDSRLALEIYEQLNRTNGSAAELLEELKDALHAEIIIRNEANEVLYQTEDAYEAEETDYVCTRNLILAEETIKLQAVRSELPIDSYCFEACINALQAALLKDTDSYQNVQKMLVKLILDGEFELAQRRAVDLRLSFPSEALIWLLKGDGKANLIPWINMIRDYCESFGKVYFIVPDEMDLILILEPMPNYRTELNHASILAQYCRDNRVPAALICGGRMPECMRSLQSVREELDTLLEEGKKVYPEKLFFGVSELQFIRACLEEANQDRNRMTCHKKIIERLGGYTEDRELIETLAVYVLDENMSISDTSARLFVHRNTIKYRLQKAEDLLGCEMGNQTDLQNLVTALSIYRLKR